MARPARITVEILAPLIRARGPVSATELAAALRVNRTTIARTLPDFGEELATLGATRSTRYLLRRGIRNIGSRWPVFRIGEDGRASEWAELEALHERSWRVNWAGAPPEWASIFTEGNGLWSGFPFFLGDLRPQGFLGRLIATRISRLLLVSEDPQRWGDDDVLVFLQAAGEDLPGNLVLGEETLRRALAGAADLPAGRSIREEDRETLYPSQAVEVSQNLPVSSAGGEQPKFLVTLRAADGGCRPVLVKFSAPLEQETGRRWADLLACEFHAHEVLAEAGLALAGARLMDAGGRRFLEIPRFDRSGAAGRMGVVSLEALSAASAGLARDWNTAGAELLRRGLINAGSLATIQRLQTFGELIGNSDMHAGNLAFFLGDTLPLPVTPCYDMLPMLWAPGAQGEIVKRRFAPAPPGPSLLDPWRDAAAMALDFWNRVAADSRLSPDFARTAAEAGNVVRQLRGHVG
jgi:HipA-like C-terminal domain